MLHVAVKRRVMEARVKRPFACRDTLDGHDWSQNVLDKTDVLIFGGSSVIGEENSRHEGLGLPQVYCMANMIGNHNTMLPARGDSNLYG